MTAMDHEKVAELANALRADAQGLLDAADEADAHHGVLRFEPDRIRNLATGMMRAADLLRGGSGELT